MNIETSEIIDFLRELSGRNNIGPDSDIFKDIGIEGDDFHEMIEKFSAKYSVKMDSYLWYFHTNEEGQNLGIFFNPPYKRVKRIPVTPRMLSDFATKGFWDIKYPDHKIPDYRYDLIFNKIVIGIFFLFLLIWIIFKILK
jgi:hypothetical protein